MAAKQPSKTEKAKDLSASLEETMVRDILEGEFRMTKGETQKLLRAAAPVPLRQWVKQVLLRAAEGTRKS